jgi:hypothetical protein
MLDSYVDRPDDAISGNHSYVSHYSTPETAAERICLLMRRCLHEAGSLGEKHIVIACLHVRHVPHQEQRTGPCDA